MKANLPDLELNGNPDQKSNIRFFIFMLKNFKIWILFFRVPKKACQGSLFSEGANYFLIKIIFSKPQYFYYLAHANAVSGNSMSMARVHSPS